MADVDLSDLMQAPEEKPGEVSPSGGAVPVDLEDLIVEGRPLRWRDVPVQAIQNIPESAFEFGKSALQAILNPVETGQALGNIVSGGLSYLPGTRDAPQESWEARAALRNREIASANLGREKRGLPPLPPVTAADLRAAQQARTAESREDFQAAKDYFVNRYGSLDALKYTLARDPVGFAADAASVATLGAGAAAKVPTLAKAAGTVQRVAEAIDPVNAALRTAGATGKLAYRGATSALGFPSDLGGDTVRGIISESAAGRGNLVRDAMRRETTPAEVVAKAEGALGQVYPSAPELLGVEQQDTLGALRGVTENAALPPGTVEGVKTAAEQALESRRARIAAGQANIVQGAEEAADAQRRAALEEAARLRETYLGAKEAEGQVNVADDVRAARELAEQRQAALQDALEAEQLVRLGESPLLDPVNAARETADLRKAELDSAVAEQRAVKNGTPEEIRAARQRVQDSRAAFEQAKAEADALTESQPTRIKAATEGVLPETRAGAGEAYTTLKEARDTEQQVHDRLFKQADASGDLDLPGPAANGFMAQLRETESQYRGAATRATLTPKTSSVVDDLGKELVDDNKLTLRKLETYRRLLGNITNKSADPTDAAAARALVRKMDELMANADAAGAFVGEGDPSIWRAARDARRQWGERWQDNVFETVLKGESPEGITVSLFGSQSGAPVRGPNRAAELSAVKERLGADSPEWQSIQQDALDRLFSKDVGKPTFGTAFDKWARENPEIADILVPAEGREALTAARGAIENTVSETKAAEAAAQTAKGTLTEAEQSARQTRAELSRAAEARKVEANAALAKAREDVKAAEQQVRNAVTKGKIQARAEAESALRAAKETEAKAKDAAAAATREARDAYAAARATATETGAKTRAEVRATKAETGTRARAAEARAEAAFGRKIEPVMRGRNFFSEDEIDFANAVSRWTPSQQNNAKVGVRQALRDALKTPETSARLLKNLATNVKAQTNLRALFGPAEADDLVGAARAASDLRQFESQITGAPGETAETAYKRLMRTLGRRADDVRNTALLDELNAASGGELKPMLYGMEAQPWLNPNRLVTGAGLVGAGATAAGAAVAGTSFAPALGLAALSPRLVGETARAVGSAFRPAVVGAEMFRASPLAGPVGELNRIPFKTNVASQIGTMALPPEEKERLLERYREPIYQPPVPSPEDAGRLHPDLQAVVDAPVSAQPDVGGQPAPLPMSVEGERISPQVPPEVVQVSSALTPTQLKALAIVLEASPNRDEMRAVGHVLNNRARNPSRYGESLIEMLMGGEFDGFKTTREKIDEMLASERFREAEQMMVNIDAGKDPDPTDGATHFLAPRLMQQKGYTTPEWAKRAGKPIGETVFYSDVD